jgi:hypothetical protein
MLRTITSRPLLAISAALALAAATIFSLPARAESVLRIAMTA